MKKQIVKSALVAVAGVGLMAGVAMADPSLPAGSGWNWNDADYWSVTDIGQGQSYFEMRWQNAQASYDSTFGLYTTDAAGNIVDKLSVFDRTVQAGFGVSQSVWFKQVGSSWKASKDEVTWVDFGNVFGFYSDVYTSAADNISWTLYTDKSLNDDGLEHFAIAFKNPNFAAIYFEDRLNYGIWNTNDSYDYIVTSTDVVPVTAVPEPASMLLFGAGMASLAAFSRRRKDSAA